VSILFVDDEPEQARTYAAGLELRGIEARIAAGVKEAREEFGRNPFPYQLVVLDLWMPGAQDLQPDRNIQGFQTGALLFQEFRGKFRRQEPVIILSSVMEKLDAKLLQGAERVELYDKGETRPSDLARIIFRMLEPHPASPQAS
jgi:DNA-binding response OmpR family regulator